MSGRVEALHGLLAVAPLKLGGVKMTILDWKDSSPWPTGRGPIEALSTWYAQFLGEVLSMAYWLWPHWRYVFGNFCTFIFDRVTGDKERTSEKPSEKTSEKTSEKIIELIQQNNEITIYEMTSIIGVTQRSIERNLRSLRSKGKIKRIGPAKGGHWKVIDE